MRLTRSATKGSPWARSFPAHASRSRSELRPWGAIFANHIGAAIANARAFEEIRVAGKRLEEANQAA